MSPERKYIVAVEDEKEIRDLFGLLFRQEGYEINVFDHPVDALRSIRSRRPDLLILDVRLPEIPGTKVLEECDKERQTCNIPVIFCTAMHDPWGDPLLRTYLDKGRADFQKKPFDILELLDRVERQLNGMYFSQT